MRDVEFDELVRRHSGAVMAYARALCRDVWHAEEAVQETFLRAWKYRDSYSSRGSFEGWLVRICRNCVIDLAHRDAKHETNTNEVTDLVVAPDHATEIHSILAQLPLPHREVLVLCRLLGYSYESAATILDVPVGTVRSRLNRARDGLETRLYDEITEANSA